MKNFKKYIIDYLYIILGAFILAVAVNCFLVPCKISTGGVSGIATMLYYVFGIPLSVTSLIINSILFFFGYKFLNKTSVVKTAAGIIFLPIFLEITKLFGAFSDDVLISSVFGGVLAGVGVGLPVLKEASTGGSDFAALMLNKKSPYISVATFILLLDAVIIIISGIVFKNYNVMFYSVVSLYINSRVTDNILVRGNYAKSVFIISDNYEKIAAE
ncbi:MAG: YitT family protein, partial [Clostridia bacterium]|nr:YitT family protein [Clostridia bacterium]